MSAKADEDDKIDILIVDDRPEGRLTLEAVLDGLGYTCYQAASGIEAIKMVTERDFAVILLDVQMPGMDGFETARCINEIESAKNTSIIFITAINKEEAHVYRGYDCGAVDYIFKPFDPLILKSKVAVLVELYDKNKKIKRQARLLVEAEQRERSRQLAEMELKNLRQYQDLANSVPHIVWRTGVNRSADYFNRIWFEYTGFASDKSMGHGWQKAFNASDLALILSIWDKAQERNENFEGEGRIRNGRDDEPERWHLIRGVLQRDSEFRPAGWIVTCTDIHGRKQATEELERQAKELLRSNKELEQFAFSASHDLQEPLRKILNFGDLLKSEGTGISDKGREYLTRIQGAASRMSELIDNLLRYSRIVTKEKAFEPVDLNRTVKNALLNLELQIKTANAEVSVGSLPTVFASRVSMSQLFQNLISNAIKFRSECAPQIRIDAERDGDEWSFSVRDNGIGIDPSHFERIFGIFQRLHTWHKYPGTGMGLAIVKKIVEGHNGSIWVDSELGKGSTFRFRLPVYKPDNTTPDTVFFDSIEASENKSSLLA